MKGKKQLGLVLMTFAIALVMCFGVKLQAKAQLANGEEFFNESNANGEAGQVVKFMVTKKAKGKGEDQYGECKVIGCKKGVKNILIAAWPVDEDGYVYHTVGMSNGCFAGNTSLKTVQINLGVGFTAIPEDCFSGCSNLKTVTILDTKIKTIGARAFSNCKKLSAFKIKSKNIKKSGVKTGAFKNVKKVTVYGPTSKVAKNYATWFVKKGAKKATSRTF